MKKNIIVWALVIMIAILTFDMKAKGNDDTSAADSDYYHMLEDRCITVVKATLDNEGYSLAGINVSNVININGTRDYKIVIHHDRFAEVDEANKEQLLAKLSNITIIDSKCNVEYELTY